MTVLILRCVPYEKDDDDDGNNDDDDDDENGDNEINVFFLSFQK